MLRGTCRRLEAQSSSTASAVKASKPTAAMTSPVLASEQAALSFKAPHGMNDMYIPHLYLKLLCF